MFGRQLLFHFAGNLALQSTDMLRTFGPTFQRQKGNSLLVSIDNYKDSHYVSCLEKRLHILI